MNQQNKKLNIKEDSFNKEEIENVGKGRKNTKAASINGLT